MSDIHAPEMTQRDNSGADVGDPESELVTNAGDVRPTPSAAGEDASGSTPGDDLGDAEGSIDDGGPDDASVSGGRGSRSRGGRTSVRRLEEEGEVAADYLEELLDIVDLDGDIDIDVENGRASVAIIAETSVEADLRKLVGARGEVLEALQELARLSVQARTGERSRLMLDVAGFRAARRTALEAVAARACQEVLASGSAVRLDPMSAFERKVVHDVVADSGLVSESEGEEPSRRVVILPSGS